MIELVEKESSDKVKKIESFIAKSSQGFVTLKATLLEDEDGRYIVFDGDMIDDAVEAQRFSTWLKDVTTRMLKTGKDSGEQTMMAITVDDFMKAIGEFQHTRNEKNGVTTYEFIDFRIIKIRKPSETAYLIQEK